MKIGFIICAIIFFCLTILSLWYTIKCFQDRKYAQENNQEHWLIHWIKENKHIFMILLTVISLFVAIAFCFVACNIQFITNSILN